jgi:hypothetical protein
MDIKAAFQLLPVYPGDFNLMGFKIDSDYFIDKCAVLKMDQLFSHFVFHFQSFP